ncbi:MAG: mechanosensitive ion channel [Candidatus Thorarchaeota archaeon]
MQLDLWEAFVALIEGILAPYGLQSLSPFVALIPFLVLIYVAHLIVIRTLRISFRRLGMPPEASSGVVFVVRLVFFAIAIVAIMAVSNILLGQSALAVSTLVGTAIGLAFSRALGNLVSGIYVLGARPFRVGDYVRIGDQEGIVLEITLNYTRLLLPNHIRSIIPNGRVVDAGVVNYRVRVDEYLEERGVEYRREHGEESLLRTGMAALKQLTLGDEVYRHAFDVFVHKDYPLAQVLAQFESVCDKWAQKFLKRPEYTFMGIQSVGLIYSFAYMVKNSADIITLGNAFRQEVCQTLMGQR